MGPLEAPDGEVKGGEGSVVLCVFPVHVQLCGDRCRIVEGRREQVMIEDTEVGLCISGAGRLGGEAWHTQKLPGMEITKPFPKMRCLPLPAGTLSLWLKAVCTSTLSRGLSQACPLPSFPAGAAWEGQELGAQKPLKDELQSMEVGKEVEGQDPLPQ